MRLTENRKTVDASREEQSTQCSDFCFSAHHFHSNIVIVTHTKGAQRK